MITQTFIVSKNGTITTVYNKSTHLLLKSLGQVDVSDRIGDIFYGANSWWCYFPPKYSKNMKDEDAMLGPFDTKEDTVQAEENTLTKYNFFVK